MSWILLILKKIFSDVHCFLTPGKHRISKQKMDEIQRKINEDRRMLEEKKDMEEEERNKVKSDLEEKEMELKKYQ